jgi:hypothetical protein
MTEKHMHRLDHCPEGHWELAQTCPQEDLAGDVVRYAGYLEHAGWSIDQREVAAPIVPLIVNFGDPFSGPHGCCRTAGSSKLRGGSV